MTGPEQELRDCPAGAQRHEPHQVVIVGAGFWEIEAPRHLAHSRVRFPESPVSNTLIGRGATCAINSRTGEHADFLSLADASTPAHRLAGGLMAVLIALSMLPPEAALGTGLPKTRQAMRTMLRSLP